MGLLVQRTRGSSVLSVFAKTWILYGVYVYLGSTLRMHVLHLSSHTTFGKNYLASRGYFAFDRFFLFIVLSFQKTLCLAEFNNVASCLGECTVSGRRVIHVVKNIGGYFENNVGRH